MEVGGGGRAFDASVALTTTYATGNNPLLDDAEGTVRVG